MMLRKNAGFVKVTIHCEKTRGISKKGAFEKSMPNGADMNGHTALSRLFKKENLSHQRCQTAPLISVRKNGPYIALFNRNTNGKVT